MSLPASTTRASMIERLGRRASVIHLKDMAPGEHRADAPVGAGIINWDDILAAGRAAGARWYIVEQDHPQNPLAFPVLMGLAFGFGLTREWRGSLAPCMVMHALHNGLVSLVFLSIVSMRDGSVASWFY